MSGRSYVDPKNKTRMRPSVAHLHKPLLGSCIIIIIIIINMIINSSSDINSSIPFEAQEENKV